MGLIWDRWLRTYLFSEFEYRARPVKVVDGDTCDLIVDLGLRGRREERFRLLGIDTPELTSPDPEVKEAANRAKVRIYELLGLGDLWGDRWPLRITTLKGDSFGRWLATIFCRDAVDEEISINAILLKEGLAVPYKK